MDATKTYFRDKIRIPVTLGTRLMAIMDNELCLPMAPRTDAETFSWTQDQYESDPQIPPWNRSVRQVTFYILYSQAILFGEMRTSDVLYMTQQDRLSDLRAETVHLWHSVRYRVLETRPKALCSNYTSVSECVLMKQLDVALERCGCMPFSFRSVLAQTYPSSIPYCNVTLYSICQSHLLKRLDVHRATCSNMCEYVIYDWRQ